MGLESGSILVGEIKPCYERRERKDPSNESKVIAKDDGATCSYHNYQEQLAVEGLSRRGWVVGMEGKPHIEQN